MTKRERKYFNDNKKCRKEYIGGFVRVTPQAYHGYLNGIPLIFDDILLPQPHTGIITKARKSGYYTTLTISPSKINP